MSDELRNRLARLSDRVPEGGGALERLRETRERRARATARRALAVGLSIVLVGAVVAVTALRDDGAVPAPGDSSTAATTWQLPPTTYLWPENWARAADRDELAQVQERADAGDPDVAWRLDPEQTLRRFLATVLAWEEPTIRELDALAAGRLFSVTPPCPGGVDCQWDTWLTVTLDQPAGRGDGGVWSVAAATNDALGLDVPTDGVVQAGSDLRFQLQLPDGRSAHAGIVASNGCREASEFASAIDRGDPILRVPAAEDDDPACGASGAGYLFVYAMDDTTVPTGDPLLEAAAIEYPWLSMIPVEVQMATPDATGDAAEAVIIECTGPGSEGTRVLTPTVAAQSDGVHVEVRNTSDVDLGISFANVGDNADIGVTELVLDSPPGPERALCLGNDTDPGEDPGPAFEVVDPNGFWVSTDLGGEVCSVGNIDYGELPAGIADPVEAARDALGRRVEDGDTLHVAGYPDARVEKVVVLERDGRAIASVAMFEGSVGWFAHTVTTCE